MYRWDPKAKEILLRVLERDSRQSRDACLEAARGADVELRAEVVPLAFSPDGRTLASASDEQTVRLWRVASGRELLVLASPSKIIDLAFSPDGMTLAAGTWVPGRASVYLWRGKLPPAPATDEKSQQGEP